LVSRASARGPLPAQTLHCSGKWLYATCLDVQLAERQELEQGQRLVRFLKGDDVLEHFLVMPDDGFLADPVQCRHGAS